MTPLGEFLRHRNAATRAAAGELEDSPDLPAWVIDMCGAIDKLIDLHAGGVDPCRDVREGGCETLQMLAFPYRSDPDYRHDWRPLDRPRPAGSSADHGEDRS